MTRFLSPSRTAMLQAALFLALVASTIAFVTTTLSSRALVEPIRIAATALFVLIILTLAIASPKVQKKALISVVILIFLLSLGLLNMAVRGTSIGEHKFMIMNFSLMVAFSFAISMRSERENDRPLALAIVIYVIFFLLVTVVLGGIKFTPFPHYIMEYISIQNEKSYTITYGQGVTKFFGIGAICACYLAATSHSSRKRIVSLALALVLLFFSLLGGARGDVVAAVIVALFALRKGGGSLVWSFLTLIFVAIIFLSTIVDFESLTLIERFGRLSMATSTRVGLGDDALGLLVKRPDCLLLGCGFYFFQDYYGYSLGLYPHIVLLEFLIVFGLIVSLVVFSFAVSGLLLAWRRKNNLGLLSPLLLFFFLIGLKSGSLVTSWILMAGIMYFAGIGATSVSYGYSYSAKSNVSR